MKIEITSWLPELFYNGQRKIEPIWVQTNIKACETLVINRVNFDSAREFSSHNESTECQKMPTGGLLCLLYYIYRVRISRISNSQDLPKCIKGLLKWSGEKNAAQISHGRGRVSCFCAILRPWCALFFAIAAQVRRQDAAISLQEPPPLSLAQSGSPFASAPPSCQALPGDTSLI